MPVRLEIARARPEIISIHDERLFLFVRIGSVT
jgi:hypothetical protein